MADCSSVKHFCICCGTSIRDLLQKCSVCGVLQPIMWRCRVPSCGVMCVRLSNWTPHAHGSSENPTLECSNCKSRDTQHTHRQISKCQLQKWFDLLSVGNQVTNEHTQWFRYTSLVPHALRSCGVLAQKAIAELVAEPQPFPLESTACNHKKFIQSMAILLVTGYNQSYLDILQQEQSRGSCLVSPGSVSALIKVHLVHDCWNTLLQTLSCSVDWMRGASLLPHALPDEISSYKQFTTYTEQQSVVLQMDGNACSWLLKYSKHSSPILAKSQLYILQKVLRSRLQTHNLKTNSAWNHQVTCIREFNQRRIAMSLQLLSGEPSVTTNNSIKVNGARIKGYDQYHASLAASAGSLLNRMAQHPYNLNTKLLHDIASGLTENAIQKQADWLGLLYSYREHNIKQKHLWWFEEIGAQTKLLFNLCSYLTNKHFQTSKDTDYNTKAAKVLGCYTEHITNKIQITSVYKYASAANAKGLNHTITHGPPSLRLQSLTLDAQLQTTPQSMGRITYTADVKDILSSCPALVRGPYNGPRGGLRILIVGLVCNTFFEQIIYSNRCTSITIVLNSRKQKDTLQAHINDILKEYSVRSRQQPTTSIRVRCTPVHNQATSLASLEAITNKHNRSQECFHYILVHEEVIYTTSEEYDAYCGKLLPLLWPLSTPGTIVHLLQNEHAPDRLTSVSQMAQLYQWQIQALIPCVKLVAHKRVHRHTQSEHEIGQAASFMWLTRRPYV